MIEKLEKHHSMRVGEAEYHYDEMGDKINEIIEAVNRLEKLILAKIEMDKAFDKLDASLPKNTIEHSGGQATTIY